LERKNFEFCFVSQVDGIADMAGGAELVNKLNSLEVENKNLKKGNISQFCFIDNCIKLKYRQNSEFYLIERIRILISLDDFKVYILLFIRLYCCNDQLFITFTFWKNMFWEKRAIAGVP
jgi:hypothetical protein